MYEHENSVLTTVALGGTDLSVVRGFDVVTAEAVVAQSQQARMLVMTPRDGQERFRTVETALEWYESAESRMFYSLQDTVSLAGIAWFTKTRHPQHAAAEYTFAIRMYDGYAGRGLGKAFAEAVHEDIKTDYDGALWADIHHQNIPSQRLAQSLGYRQVASTVPERRHFILSRAQ